MHLHIHPDADTLSKALAKWITDTIETALQNQEQFTWVVTGGNSPKQLYELLATGSYKDRINWNKMHIFWGDERAVPFTDSRNNAKMTFEYLLNNVPVPAKNIHIMNTALPPEQAAAAYDKILHQYFGPEGHSFDLVLNGMGDDGHTLSLFPHTAVIHEKQDWVKAYYLEPQQMHRITLTAPVVNRARQIAFLTFGANKAHALQAVLEGPSNVDQYPSQIIQPVNGQLHWFVDEAAATGLSDKHRLTAPV